MKLKIRDGRAQAVNVVAETEYMPQHAAADLKKQLQPMFSGQHLNVEYGRGVGVQFSRWEAEDYAKQQLKTNYQMPSNLSVHINITPANPLSGWSSVAVYIANKLDKESMAMLKQLGVSFRKKGKLTPKKAVDYVVAWFKKNAIALKG